MVRGASTPLAGLVAALALASSGCTVLLVQATRGPIEAPEHFVRASADETTLLLEFQTREYDEYLFRRPAVDEPEFGRPTDVTRSGWAAIPLDDFLRTYDVSQVSIRRGTGAPPSEFVRLRPVPLAYTDAPADEGVDAAAGDPARDARPETLTVKVDRAFGREIGVIVYRRDESKKLHASDLAERRSWPWTWPIRILAAPVTLALDAAGGVLLLFALTYDDEEEEAPLCCVPDGEGGCKALKKCKDRNRYGARPPSGAGPVLAACRAE